MSNVPDAWDDDWSAAVDTTSTPPTELSETKKVSSKVSKAQRRAQQAEFNRQLWAAAEGPKETNYFLESRNIVPLRSEFKPPPVLLSRKGPPTIVRPNKTAIPTDGLANLDLNNSRGAESSEDEDEIKQREQTLAERQAQAAKDREEKQRKYEERRQELFGTPSNTTGNNTNNNGRPNSHSGTSTPNSLTPPGSRSSTPSRGRGRGRGGRGGGGMGSAAQHNASRQQHQQQRREQELFDPTYAARPERRESPLTLARQGEQQQHQQRPIRTPKGPDGSGRGGFGFAARGARQGVDAASTVPEGVPAP